MFNNFHGNYLSDETKIFSKVATLVNKQIKENNKIPWDVLMCLVRTRTYIRLKIINKQRKDAIERIRISKRSAQKQKFYY